MSSDHFNVKLLLSITKQSSGFKLPSIVSHVTPRRRGDHQLRGAIVQSPKVGVVDVLLHFGGTPLFLLFGPSTHLH